MDPSDKRRDTRHSYDIPDFVSVQFRLGDSEKTYELNVVDCCRNGIGLLITKKDLDILQKVKRGDKIHDMSFFASWTMITVDGTVCHQTKIEKGKFKGCCLMGIKSDDFIESCKPEKA